MSAIYSYLQSGGTKLKVTPRLVTSGVEKTFDQFEVELPAINKFELTFENIGHANSLVGGASDVAHWNTYFKLPAKGNPFTSVTVVGNVVTLIGGSNITLKNASLTPEWWSNAALISVIDTGCIVGAESSVFAWSDYLGILTTIELPSLVTAGYETFAACEPMTIFSFPNLVTIGNGCFRNNHTATVFYLPKLENLGTNVFNGITGQIITLTIPVALITSNSGTPNINIQYLIDNNDLTIITV